MRWGDGKRTQRRLIQGLCLAGCVSCVASVADAQTSESRRPADPQVLGEIIVTAQKREERLLDVPLSISAFTATAMQDSGAAQLGDFLESAPGVSLVDSHQGDNNIQIRGISSQFGDSPVGYYLDELPFSFLGNPQVPDVRTFDLERVEVLRGPQGTLYGDGSIGGTVRILTAVPQLDDVAAAVDVTGAGTSGGEESYAARGMVNIPLSKDVAGLRLVASKEEIGGWIDRPATGAKDVNDRDVQNYRAKLRIAPTERLDVILSAWRTEEVSADRAVSAADRTTILDPTRFTTEYDLYSATVQYDLDFAQLLSATSWMEFEDHQLGSFAGAPLTNDRDYDVLSEELRLTSKNDGTFRWTGGLFYRKTEGRVDAAFLTFRTTSIGESESYAVFGEGTWTLLDQKLDLTLGLRYFEDDRLTNDPLDPATLALIRTLDPSFTLPVEESFNTLNPRFNLAFHVADDWLLYTNVAKGFRSGLVQPTSSLVPAILTGRTDVPTGIKEDRLWSYELGTKGSFAGGRVTLESAVYLNDWDNLQVNVVVDPANFISALINAGSARTVGLEVALALRPVDGLTFRLSGSQMKAEYTEDVPNANIRDGDRVRGVPETTLAAAATYRWPLGTTINGFVHGNAQYTSDRVDVPNGLIPSDSLTTVDLRIGVEGASWGAYLVGENLTDENGAADVIFPGFGGVTTRLRPRTYGLNLRYNFN